MLRQSLDTNHEIIRACYRGILGRDPDKVGYNSYVERLDHGLSLEIILRRFIGSKEFFNKFIRKIGINLPGANDKFPVDYISPVSEAGKSYHARRTSGFFEKYMNGEKVLDIGYKGYDNSQLRTVVPHAIGVDLDFPGYDGVRLPFEDATIDCVFSSHCLEHIPSYQDAIRDWYRVARLGGIHSMHSSIAIALRKATRFTLEIQQGSQKILLAKESSWGIRRIPRGKFVSNPPSGRK